MTSNTKLPKSQVLLVGGSGLIGSRLAELFYEKYEVESLGITDGVDITDRSTLSVVEKSTAKVVIHLAAKADVDACEKDKDQGTSGAAWRINVLGAENVAKICADSGKRMIYFSTDFVFNGEKKTGESYTEVDTPSPLNWYAVTKYEGENVVRKSGAAHVILRTAYPYRSEFTEKKDFVRAIKSNLEEGNMIKAVTDHIMCPTFIDDMNLAISTLIDENQTGIYNMSGSSALSPFQAAKMIANEFQLDDKLIHETTREEFFRGRAKRPFNISMKNDKILRLGVTMNSFAEGLKEMHKQQI